MSVPGDAARLHQVVTNLLANASKYIPACTTITVTGSADGLTVHDDGPGFSPELAPSAFERFTRGDAARTRAGGAGLASSMVEAIAPPTAARSRWPAAPGDTTFTIHLPR